MIWSRKGLLVPLAIFIGVLVQVSLIVLSQRFLLGSFPTKIIGGLVMLCSFLPVLINHLFNKLFLANEISKVLYDEKGNPYQINTYSTFFFIKNRTWTKILLIWNLLLCAYTLVRMLFNI